MNRSVELSLSFQAYDTRSDDNYSPDDSKCEERARHAEPMRSNFQKDKWSLTTDNWRNGSSFTFKFNNPSKKKITIK